MCRELCKELGLQGDTLEWGGLTCSELSIQVIQVRMLKVGLTRAWWEAEADELGAAQRSRILEGRWPPSGARTWLELPQGGGCPQGPWSSGSGEDETGSGSRDRVEIGVWGWGGEHPLPLCSHNALCLCELCSAYSIFRDTVSSPPACRFLEAGAGSWLQGLESRGQDR